MPTMTNLLNLKMKQWPTLFVVNLRPRHVEQNKCDQIWLNFATLVKFSKSLAIFEGLFGYCQKSSAQGDNFLHYWINFYWWNGQIYQNYSIHLVTLSRISVKWQSLKTWYSKELFLKISFQLNKKWTIHLIRSIRQPLGLTISMSSSIPHYIRLLLHWAVLKSNYRVNERQLFVHATITLLPSSGPWGPEWKLCNSDDQNFSNINTIILSTFKDIDSFSCDKKF